MQWQDVLQKEGSISFGGDISLFFYLKYVRFPITDNKILIYLSVKKKKK